MLSSKIAKERSGSVAREFQSGFFAPLIVGASHAGRLECSGDDGSLGNGVLAVYEQESGTVSVAAETGLWRWKPGPPTLHRLTDPLFSLQPFAEDDDGTLLVGTSGGIRRFDG